MKNNKDQRDNPATPSRFWILGAGRFGQIAVERITRNIPGASLSVIDKKPFALCTDDISIIQEDGVQWLVSMLDEDAPVDMIVPAIPIHVVKEWLTLKLQDSFHIHPISVSEYRLAQMPHALRGDTGQAYVSHADFICPDNCPEPKKICTHTGKPRPLDLFRLLRKVDFDDVLPIVIRSHQLLPGVGGLFPADLLNALDVIRKHHHRPLMVATACRCHGVVDFFRLEKKV